MMQRLCRLRRWLRALEPRARQLLDRSWLAQFQPWLEQRALFRFIQRELGHSGPRLHYLTERLVQPCYAICAPLWQQAIEQRVLLSPHPAVFHFLLLGALSTTLGAVPMIAQLAGEEVDRQAILHSLRLILQGHFPDALP